MRWIDDFPVGVEFRESQRPGDTPDTFAHSLGNVWVYELSEGLYAEMVVTGIDDSYVYVTVVRHFETATRPELPESNGWLQGGLN